MPRKRCFRVESGQTTSEYAVVLSIVALAVAGLFIAFTGGIQSALTTVTGVL